MSELKILTIDGLTMRPIQISDLDSLAVIWSDPKVTSFLPSRGIPIPKENTAKSLESFVEHWQQRNYGIWAILSNNTGRMLGYSGLRYLDELNEVELLYGLDKVHWGKGIATKAAKAAVGYGFSSVNLERLVAMVLPDNIASKRVIEKAGFKYEKPIHIFNLDVLYYSAQQ